MTLHLSFKREISLCSKLIQRQHVSLSSFYSFTLRSFSANKKQQPTYFSSDSSDYDTNNNNNTPFDIYDIDAAKQRYSNNNEENSYNNNNNNNTNETESKENENVGMFESFLKREKSEKQSMLSILNEFSDKYSCLSRLQESNIILAPQNIPGYKHCYIIQLQHPKTFRKVNIIGIRQQSLVDQNEVANEIKSLMHHFAPKTLIVQFCKGLIKYILRIFFSIFHFYYVLMFFYF